MTRKLAIRSVRRGVGSMDYIHTLLIMEDNLDMQAYADGVLGDLGDPSDQHTQPDPDFPANSLVPSWCTGL